MRDDFIVDENVILNAYRGTDDKKQRAIKERAFMYCLLNGDKKLVSTPKIQSYYYRINKVILEEKEFMDAGILKFFFDRLRDTDKSPIVEGLKPRYKHIKEGDDEFVCLSIHRDGNLVTRDYRMRDEIKSEGLEDQVKYYDVSVAIPLVCT
jgi:hypothetical protein